MAYWTAISDYWWALSEGWRIFWTGTGITAALGALGVARRLTRRRSSDGEKIGDPAPTGPRIEHAKKVVIHQAPPQPAPEPPAHKQKTEAGLRVDLSRLPVTDAKLFGRDDELAMLDEAWSGGETNIVTLVAMGGTGKTALMNTWLASLGGEYGGAEAVFGWSFYSQGAREDAQASADPFFDAALTWFGYEGEPIKSPWDKGLKLAELVKAQKTLLVLDGLEPLQYPPGEMHGALKDQGLQALIKQLAAQNPGMLLITTRVAVHEVIGKPEPTVIAHDLDRLSPEDGEALLRHLKVNGSEDELREAVDEFGGHALALTLLANWLALDDGDIAKRDTIPALNEQPDQGGHAKRVMAAYETQLAGKPELAVLFLMGLFDRPAPAGAIGALLEEPAIDGLTDTLVALPEAQWKTALSHLRELGLLNQPEAEDDGSLDAHPLVREYFGVRLRELNKAAFREAHTRLYDYYRNLPDKELPETLAEMEPLFAAIAHGCAAGKHQEALSQVYVLRIQRGGQTNFAMAYLGAVGSTLAALSHFFEKPWSKPIAGVKDTTKAAMMNWVGFRLRAQGRLHECVEPMLAGLNYRIDQENWGAAAIATNNLSQLYLIIGELQQAIEMAQQGIGFADDNDDEFQRIVNRATLADALHQAGEQQAALAVFEEAETIQVNEDPNYHWLYSIQGSRYCDLLLALGRFEEVVKRAAQALEWAEAGGLALLTPALDRLSAGRAEMARTCAKGEQDFQAAAALIHGAVAGLREAGTQHHLPRGLLARTECHRHQRQFDSAAEDLDEVFEIARRSGMKLFLTDAHLESARLCRAAGALVDGHDAAHHIGEAEALIKETGYNRRLPELEELKGG